VVRSKPARFIRRRGRSRPADLRHQELDELHLRWPRGAGAEARGRLVVCPFHRWKTASSRIFWSNAARPAADRGICPNSPTPRQVCHPDQASIVADDAEISANRARRSAKLRAAGAPMPRA